ncbi:MAG: 50S ribosomal protein L11 methyltransferase [Alphaproteobacteria bacterium]|nr:50S ribosomal protein L11 methyltransferase [Alphaproteobacteria bacterium]
MTQHKIVIELGARDAAHRAAGHLQELLQPTPDALTVFEVADPSDSTDDVNGSITNKLWRIEAYFQDMEDADKLLRNMRDCLGTPTPPLRLEPVPDRNWVALSQAALPPVRSGRFTIYGSHDRHRIARGPGSILIDAGEAFGTAHHATTYGCLLALDQTTRRTTIRNALDLGCGSAVLSIALARAAPAARITATDLDAQSVVVARDNIRRNGMQRHVRAITANGLHHPTLRQRLPFDLVVANILARPLIQLAGDIAQATTVGGTLILSGILTQQSPQIQAHYCAHGFQVSSKVDMDGWTTLNLLRRATGL